MSKKEKDHSGYEFPGQHEGEEVKYVFRQHPVVMRVTLIVALVAMVIGAIPLAVKPLETWPWWFFLGGLGVALLIFGYRLIGYYFSVFIVTAERLIQITQKGFFNRKVVDLGLNKIQNVNYEVKGMQATMFGYGTITVQTYVGNLTLHYIHKPEKVHQLMVKQMRDFGPMGVADNSQAMGAGQ